MGPSPTSTNSQPVGFSGPPVGESANAAATGGATGGLKAPICDESIKPASFVNTETLAPAANLLLNVVQFAADK